MNPIVRKIYENRATKRAIIAACEKEGKPLTLQAINDWRKLRDGVPAKRVQVVARVTGLKPHTIRPDVFPREP